MKFQKYEGQKIKDRIDNHEKFKGSYFWSPPQKASARCAYENIHSRSPYKFKKAGKVYEITQEVECTCKNIYYKFSVKVDDVKKDIRALKKLIKGMEV